MYYSDRTLGPRATDAEVVTEAAWGGLVACLAQVSRSGGFGKDFPQSCPDGPHSIGTDERMFRLALMGEVPEVEWPLKPGEVPPTLAILDMIEFGHAHVAFPLQDSHHKYFDHWHLRFDVLRGQEEYRSKVNLILARNGLLYALNVGGQVERTGRTTTDGVLKLALFETGDEGLDALLESARAKYFDPDPLVRRESLEKLWDAWERLKTIGATRHKKQGIKTLLDHATSDPELRTVLEAEARALTDVGNGFHIRHSEVQQATIDSDAAVEYFFQRMFSFIWLLLKRVAP